MIASGGSESEVPPVAQRAFEYHRIVAGSQSTQEWMQRVHLLQFTVVPLLDKLVGVQGMP